MTRLLLLVIVALFVGVSLVGCGPKKGEATQTPASTPTSSETTTTKTTSSVGGLALADIPIYPSLRQVQKASQQFPMTAGYARADVRAYETNDSAEKIVVFYKSQMPANGWVETQWLDTAQFKNGAYTRNSERDIALIWIVSAEGKTELILMRATKE